jgi:hypothetical protein
VLRKPRYDASVGVFLTITVGGLLIDIHTLQDGEVTEVCLNYRMNRHSAVGSRLVAIGGVLLNEEFFCSTVAGG